MDIKDNNSQTWRRPLSHDDYTVGWVCALPLELIAATVMLEEEHESLPFCSGDKNNYTLGRIGPHNVVLVCLPSYGTTKAATVASNMLRSFPNIHIGLMVGIGGGVPTTRNDVRLGDVVVGDLIIQYDLGKTVHGGRFERMGHTGKLPPDHLAAAVKTLQARQDLQPSWVSNILTETLANHASFKSKHARPTEPDRLFVGGYDHIEDSNSESGPCASCDPSQLVQRLPRPNADCKVHHGKIASGNQVIKHAGTRDRLASELGVICFEMEAAGLLDANLPCLVIRGISDYADSHKNDHWRGYAAATAAAYTKKLLATIPAMIPKDLSLYCSLLKIPPRIDTYNPHRPFAFCQVPTERPLQQPVLGPGMPPKTRQKDTILSKLLLSRLNLFKGDQQKLNAEIKDLRGLGEVIKESVNDMKAASTTIRHHLSRVTFKLRRAERVLLRVYRPTQKVVRQDLSSGPMAFAAHPILADLAQNPLKRKRLDESSIEDGLPEPKRLFGPSIPVSPHISASARSCQQSQKFVDQIFSGGSSSAPELVGIEDFLSLSRDEEINIDLIMTDTVDLMELGEDCASSCSSSRTLTSSVTSFIHEEGHTYHCYGMQEYMLPNDESWMYLEDLLHYLLHDLTLDHKSLLCLTFDFKGCVLDVGTGTGSWVLDIADHFSFAQVIGIDISPIQPDFVPSNSTFYIDDLAKLYEPVFPCSEYHPDIIHFRNMTMAIYDWVKLLQWVKREVNPGGYVEFQEMLWYPYIQGDSTIEPYTGRLAEYFQTLAQAFSAVGISLNVPQYLHTNLKMSGFRHVTREEFFIPLGGWAKDSRQKEMGAFLYYFLHGAVEPMASRVLRSGLQYRPNEVQTWAARFRKTIKESVGEKILFKFIVVHGQKCRDLID